MKKSFLRAAGLLALGMFLAKIIGAFYRIPLTNILGAEGMGVYQLIFPVYAFLLSTSSGALPLAISVMVADKLAADKKDEAKIILNSAMSVLMFMGVLITIGLLLLASPISRLQGNETAMLGYVAIAPAIFFVSGISVLRGWFQGNNNMLPSAISNFLEAVIKLAVGLTLAVILLPRGLKWGVFGALLGVTISEAVSFIVLYIIYRRKNERFRLNLNIRDARQKYREILKISIPITIGGMILPFSQIIDSMLVINILTGPLGNTGATASYGLFTGYVNTLINLPILLALSIGVAIIPQLSKGKAERNIELVKQKCNTAVKIALVIGVPFAILFLALPYGILTILYPSLAGAELTQAATLLRISAVSVIGLAATQIYTSILQGLGDMFKPMISLGIGVGVKLALTLILLPAIGIYGVAIASVACFATSALLNSIFVVKLTGPSPAFFKNSSVIFFSGVIMCGAVLLVSYFTAGRVMTIITAIVGGILYILFLLLFKAFDDNELKSMPFGKVLLKLSQKLRRVKTEN
jgi:stage V sporulation protein B